jgi:DNA polymerase III subunit epsilon
MRCMGGMETMKIFWFDCETSGIDPVRNGIIQLAYAVEIDDHIQDHGEFFSNCEGKEIDDGALQVNGFTREQIAGFPPPREMYLQLSSLLNIYVDKYDKEDKFTAGGFNVNFDMGFLRQLWSDCGDSYFGSWFSFGVIDPAQIIRFLQYCGSTRFYSSAKLVDIAKAYKIDSTGAHNAFTDIKMTIAVCRAIRKELKL